MRYLDTLIVATVFTAFHLGSPKIAQRLAPWRLQVASFSAGLAMAYVCLHLLAEIDAGHVLLGRRIYFLVLVGLGSFYAVEIWVGRTPTHRRHAAHFRLMTGILAVYSFLLVFTLTVQLPRTTALTLVYAISVGLHLLSTDFTLLELFGDRFRKTGRWILIGAVILGFGASLVRDPDEVAVDSVTAALAGFVLFNVFRRELPGPRDAHFPLFLLGSLVFLGANLLLGAAA